MALKYNFEEASDAETIIVVTTPFLDLIINLTSNDRKLKQIWFLLFNKNLKNTFFKLPTDKVGQIIQY